MSKYLPKIFSKLLINRVICVCDNILMYNPIHVLYSNIKKTKKDPLLFLQTWTKEYFFSPQDQPTNFHYIKWFYLYVWNQVELYWRDWGRKVGLVRHNLHIYIYMLLRIFELRVQNKNEILDKTVTMLFLLYTLNVVSYSWKMAEKGPFKLLKKYI